MSLNISSSSTSTNDLSSIQFVPFPSLSLNLSNIPLSNQDSHKSYITAPPPSNSTSSSHVSHSLSRYLKDETISLPKTQFSNLHIESAELEAEARIQNILSGLDLWQTQWRCPTIPINRLPDSKVATILRALKMIIPSPLAKWRGRWGPIMQQQQKQQ